MCQKEQLNNYRQLQKDYLTDIDLSGGTNIEYQKFNNNKNGNNKHSAKD